MRRDLVQRGAQPPIHVENLAKSPVVQSFQPILALIQQSRRQALQAVNVALVDLYWRIGEYISQKIQADGWGQGTVTELSAWLRHREPGLRGFSAQNLWRMRQFVETYREDAVLSPLVRVLPWTHNLLILSKCRSAEERGVLPEARRPGTLGNPGAGAPDRGGPVRAQPHGQAKTLSGAERTSPGSRRTLQGPLCGGFPGPARVP